MPEWCVWASTGLVGVVSYGRKEARMARMSEDARFTAVTEKALTGALTEDERRDLAALVDKRKAREELPAAEADVERAQVALDAAVAHLDTVRERAGEKKGRRR